MKKETAIDRIRNEYKYSCSEFIPLNDKYQGYALILQELDELWMNIKGDVEPHLLKGNATRIAALSLKFLTDCC